MYEYCMRCGKKLTDPKSKSLGLGPVCRKYLRLELPACRKGQTRLEVSE